MPFLLLSLSPSLSLSFSALEQLIFSFWTRFVVDFTRLNSTSFNYSIISLWSLKMLKTLGHWASPLLSTDLWVSFANYAFLNAHNSFQNVRFVNQGHRSSSWFASKPVEHANVAYTCGLLLLLFFLSFSGLEKVFSLWGTVYNRFYPQIKNSSWNESFLELDLYIFLRNSDKSFRNMFCQRGITEHHNSDPSLFLHFTITWESARNSHNVPQHKNKF